MRAIDLTGRKFGELEVLAKEVVKSWRASDVL
jgi:hypothetical protein